MRLNRNALILGLALGLVVAGTAAGIVLAFKSDQGRLTRAAYIRRVNAICDSFGKRLDKIPPPLDPASPGAVYESIGLALPLLREQSERVRSLRPPAALQTDVDRFFLFTDRSLAHLRRARDRAGQRALFPMVQSLSAFENARDQAKSVSREIGFRC
jgi:hypothetical protein